MTKPKKKMPMTSLQSKLFEEEEQDQVDQNQRGLNEESTRVSMLLQVIGVLVMLLSS